ncbi:MAG: GNAT family N-acetyltransferase [Nocardioides sp.]
MTSVLERTTWPKRTSRLALRPALLADLREIRRIRALPEVAQWMPDRPDDYDEFVLRAGRTNMLSRLLVIELSGILIGHLYLRVENAWGQVEVAAQTVDSQAELGWCLDPAYQGEGYATEAVSSLIGVCFSELEVRRVVALAFAANTASQAVMRRLGMRHEGTYLRESLHRDLGWVDGVSYALLAEEWRAQQ